ncbi:mechanosensitive ion channel family protein [bacterium]|nr:mechanosensitive ion channel family protein [bacterium]
MEHKQFYWGDMLSWLIAHGPTIVIAVVLAFVLIQLSRTLSSRIFGTVVKHKRGRDVEFQKRAETLRSILHFLFSAVIGTTAAVIVLDEIGVNVGPILAAAGVLGLAVGFGAQSLVKDIISGFFIFLEDQIRVGDVIEVAGKAGVVERMNLRVTILRDLSGNVHFVPNGEINVVTNMTKGYSRYVFDIGVAYREDVDEVTAIMQQVDESLRSDPDFKDDILEPLEILGLDQFADSALVIKARTMTKPIKQWRVAREFNRRLKIAFDEHQIEIPFPHRTVYIGMDKNGTSPPLNIVLGHADNPGGKK